MTIEKDIKEALKLKKVVIGGNSVLRGVKTGSVKSIIRASNFPDSVMMDLNHYKSVGNISIEIFNGNSKQLGEVCGKPFNVSIIGLKK